MVNRSRANVFRGKVAAPIFVEAWCGRMSKDGEANRDAMKGTTPFPRSIRTSRARMRERWDAVVSEAGAIDGKAERMLRRRKERKYDEVRYSSTKRASAAPIL